MPSIHSTHSAQAFAKSFIFGEYAVLHGEPAIVLALDRRIVAHWESDSGSYNTSVEAQVAQALAAPDGAMLHFKSDDFYDERNIKLGLGASAATVVAARIAWAKRQKQNFPLREGAGIAPFLREAVQWHRDLQSKMGSGADVIAAALGGVVIVSDCMQSPRVERLALNALPPFALLSAMQSASTTERLRPIQSMQNDATYQSLQSQLGSLARLAVHHAKARDYSAFLACVGAVDPLLERLESLLGTHIITDGHRRLQRAAHAEGLAVKVSGAGGGDLSLVFGAELAQVQAFANTKARALGFLPIPVRVAPAREFTDEEI